MGEGGDLVLLGAADAEAGVVPLGGGAHRDLVVGVGEAVVVHVVQDLDGAVLVALAGLREHVRGVGHRLLAARHHDVELTRADELVGEGDGVEAREADLVDVEGGDVHRDAGLDGGLPGRELARSGLEHLTHDHVLHLVPGDPGPVQGGLDGEAPRSAAEKEAREPSILPMGVRAPATITEVVPVVPDIRHGSLDEE